MWNWWNLSNHSLTSWCILWYTFASLSRTTKDWEGAASPLKMKLRSPRWHFISVKSMRVVSSLNQERGQDVCEDRCVLLLGSKRSMWPGYQQFAALKTKWIRFSHGWGRSLNLLYLITVFDFLPDINTLLVDFTSIRWKHPGQQRHYEIKKRVWINSTIRK